MTIISSLPKDNEGFHLFETLLWENGGFFLLNEHIDRLKRSADCLSFPIDPLVVLNQLKNHSTNFDPVNKYRSRLVLDKSGKITVTSSVITSPVPVTASLIFSEKKTEKTNPFLFHKTSRRILYDQELASCRDKGFYEVIFTNTDGEITEGSITNIIIKRGGVFLTPPLSSGILPGTYREYLLTSQIIPIKEKILYPDDLLSSAEIFIINSVIKKIHARF